MLVSRYACPPKAAPTDHLELLHVQETKAGSDAAQYTSSTIVQTSAPRELGQLRAADGDEGFAAKTAAKVKALANGVTSSLGIN